MTDVEEYTCYELNDIVSSVKVDILENLLIEAAYDSNKTQFLVEGFRHGFDLGYRGPSQCQDTSANIPLKVGDPLDRWNKIMKEVKLGRYAEPYQKIPYQYYVQSPVGLVPKAGGKTRLIFHLSYDFQHEITEEH